MFKTIEIISKTRSQINFEVGQNIFFRSSKLYGIWAI